jgi:hypothetical protein
MHITLVDDSIVFDAYSAASRPLGGAEKAFASLPGALARRGHEVHVINRCRWGMQVDGAQWVTLDDGRKPPRTDVLIAFRKPSLLEFIRHADKRVLWFTGPGRLLARKTTAEALDTHKPLVLLIAEAQAHDLPAKEWQAKGLQAALLPAAVRADFLAGTIRPAAPPRAIVTTHPSHGLDWLLDLWTGRIHPACPEAELFIYSMTLAKAAEGGDVEPEMMGLADKVMAARDHGVVVMRPQADHLMAESYRQASVHLFPGHGDDMGCFTLMESQASGCPAVVRALGAAPERVSNGHSANVAPDDDAFVNLTTMLLSHEDVQRNMGAQARALYAGRTWDAAAAALEGWLK